METAAVVITGPPGAGKSSVLERLTTLLGIDGVEFGAVESEQLGWGHPWLSPELVARQLAAVLEIQRRAGRRLFVIVATTETEGELREIAAATGAAHVTTVLLLAEPDTVARRIEEREPDEWPGKPALVAHARELAVSMRDRLATDIVVRTDGRDPGDVARQVRDALRATDALT